MPTWLFVFTRIVANPLSNVFQKRLGVVADARFIIFVTHALLTLVCLPALIWMAPRDLGAGFWSNMLISAMLAVAGNTLIVAALQSADLSVLGPLNAYKSVVGLVLGVVLLREYPNAAGIAGIAMILAGSGFILEPPLEPNGGEPRAPFAERIMRSLANPGVRLRFAALVLSAAEAVFLKRALQASSAGITFVFWCMLGAPLAALVAYAGLRGRMDQQFRQAQRERTSVFLLAGTTGLMQYSTLYTFEALQVGYSLALFQTSTLLSVLFGYGFFREQNIGRRLLGAAVMIVGAILIVSFGSAW